MIGLANANSLRIPLASGSVHCVVTSPPYYGLRKYAAGDEQLGSEELHDCLGWARGEPPCGRCFVCNLRAVFAEVWRVLRDDGVAWLNLGDSYAANRSYQARPTNTGNRVAYKDHDEQGAMSVPPGLRTGDLIGVPWRVALALQADGWVLRSDVIWAKRSAMPESVNGWRWERCRVKVKGARTKHHGREVSIADAHKLDSVEGFTIQLNNQYIPAEYTDCPGCATCEADGGYVLRRGSWRPTSSHEYIFQLVKGMAYFSDREAVKTGDNGTSANLRDVWRIPVRLRRLRKDLDDETKERVIGQLLERGLL